MDLKKLSCLFAVLLITSSPGWCVDMNEIPSAPPQDSIMAGPREIAQIQDWADLVFGTADGKKMWPDNRMDSLLGAGSLPFSFVYGGKLSRDLMGTWAYESRTVEEADWIRREVSWTDPDTKIQVQATVRSFRRYPATDWVIRFRNTGSGNSPILEDIQALDMPLRTKGNQTVTVRRNYGDVFDERSFSFFTTGLNNGDSVHIAPHGGRSSNGAFPFFEVQYGDHPTGTENLIVAVGWSGQWAADVICTATGSVRLRAGMERTRFYLQPGESVRTPRILLMTSEGDLTLAHQRFRRLMLFEYFPKIDGKPILLPFALQCFDRYSWSMPEWATEAGQIKAAQFAAQAGFDTLWFDAAWFIGGFPNGVGNWEHKPKEFPNGLRPVADACHAAGLKFLVWFEPERVAAGSRIAREHPEFVIGGAEGGLFKLNDPDARRWLTDLLSQRISEYGIDIYRNDFNMDPLSFWHRNDEPDREGITEIHYVEGLYETWDELRARHPMLWIDNCSSGGRRIDLETCMRSVPLWRSDTNCFPGREEWTQSHTVGLCSLIPLNTACAWTPDSYVMRSTMTAGLICQWDYLNGDFPMKEALSNLAELKELRKYWYGDFYPLTSGDPSPELWCGRQLHRPDLDAGIAMVFRRTESPYTGWMLRLQALDPKALYRVEIREGDSPANSEDLSGEALMTGREIKLPPRSSLLVRYKKLAPSGG
ncbi:MAG TPA: alpha-galactosidase [bacterium]|nr:alpha-galactosidase [bacterium]HQL64147.1 alpha-galactosidase [bacterium]